jgi:hypothetical protein
MILQIYADFNSQDENGRIRINPAEIAALPESLRDGLAVVLYDEEIQVDAEITGRDEFGLWAASPNWSTKRPLKK